MSLSPLASRLTVVLGLAVACSAGRPNGNEEVGASSAAITGGAIDSTSPEANVIIYIADSAHAGSGVGTVRCSI